MHHTKRAMPELSSGAMADIAFLLLTFFMMTTQIQEYRGLSLLLPPYQHEPIVTDIPDRNLFNIHINSANRLLVEGQERSSFDGLRLDIKQFVLNNKTNPAWSDNPAVAVVSIKTDRGTSYSTYLKALDEAQAAYYEIYGERVGLTADAFRNLDLSKPEDKQLYQRGRQGVPMNISIAESK